MDISIQKIEGWAPNAAAAKNGRDLVAKNKLSNLKIDAEKTVIWGDCAGSGKTPYSCSADFTEPSNPVFRCNCPSRQFPCKHGLGLAYAFEKGLTFSTDAIPEDISSKREKIEKRQEKKSQEIEAIKESIQDKAAKPKKVNVAATVKKYDAQLNGIEMAGKILTNMVQNGLSSIDSKEKRNIHIQVKELGNYYINGIQTAFNDLLLELDEVKNEEYSNVIDRINYISALLKKAADYLQKRKENPEREPETNSAIEEQIGTVWKLTDLIQHGLWEENAELVQLSFNSYDDSARKEWVDEGNWLNLKTGKIYKTKNYRPYRAAKYIKEGNSVSDIVALKELYIYPGDINPRVRWEAEARTERNLELSDIKTIHQYASANYAEVVKSIKNSIKNPLNDKNPLVLIQLHKAWLNGENIVLEDSNGNLLTLTEVPGSTALTALKMILPGNPVSSSLLVMIDNNLQTGLFSAFPLSLVSDNKIIKLVY